MNKEEAAWNPLEGPRPELTVKLNSGVDEQITIVIVHKDAAPHLNICLQSIAVTSFNNNYEIIVVDNNSNEESQEFLNDIEGEVKVIRNKKNLYWSAAANLGADAADKNSKYIVFMHCDVVVTNPSWLDLLTNVCESQNSGMVGLEMTSFFIPPKKVDFIKEWLVAFTRECWEECGPFPEKLPIIGPSFITTIKAQNKGYKPQVMKNQQIAHHYRIFSIDINEWERLSEQAQITIPQLLRDMQSEAVKKVF